MLGQDWGGEHTWKLERNNVIVLSLSSKCRSFSRSINNLSACNCGTRNVGKIVLTNRCTSISSDGS